MRCGELESIGPAPLSDNVELCLSFTRSWGIKVLPEWENSCRQQAGSLLTEGERVDGAARGSGADTRVFLSFCR